MTRSSPLVQLCLQAKVLGAGREAVVDRMGNRRPASEEGLVGRGNL